MTKHRKIKGMHWDWDYIYVYIVYIVRCYLHLLGISWKYLHNLIVFEWFVIIYWAQLALFCKTLSHTYDTMQGKNKGHFDDISTLSLQRDDLILSPINA